MSERIIAVTGGRDFSNWPLVWETLNRENPSILLQGGASGADQAAREWCRKNPTQCVTYHYRNVGRAGGPLRNRSMLEHGKPELVLAFPGGRGTASCIAEADAMGIRVLRIEP